MKKYKWRKVSLCVLAVLASVVMFAFPVSAETTSSPTKPYGKIKPITFTFNGNYELDGKTSTAVKSGNYYIVKVPNGRNVILTFTSKFPIVYDNVQIDPLLLKAVSHHSVPPVSFLKALINTNGVERRVASSSFLDGKFLHISFDPISSPGTGNGTLQLIFTSNTKDTDEYLDLYVPAVFTGSGFTKEQGFMATIGSFFHQSIQFVANLANRLSKSWLMIIIIFAMPVIGFVVGLVHRMKGM